MPLYDWTTQNDLTQGIYNSSLLGDGGALQGMSPETTSPETASPSSPQPNPPSESTPQQKEKKVDISGNIEGPTWGELIPNAFSLLGGAAGVDFRYKQIMAKKAAPVVNTIVQEINKALLSGDFDRVDEGIVGLSRVAGQFPEYSPMINGITNKVNDKRNKIEGNTAILDSVRAAAKGNPELTMIIGGLYTQIAKLDPKETWGILSQSFPQIVADKNVTKVISKYTGESETKPTPTTIDVKDYTPEEREGFRLSGVDIQKYTDMANAAATGGKRTFAEWKQFHEDSIKLQQAAQGAIGRKNYPLPQRVEGGIPGSLVNEMMGVGENQQQGIPSQQPSIQQVIPQGNQGTPQQGTTPNQISPPNNQGSFRIDTLTPSMAKRVIPNLTDQQAEGIIKDPGGQQAVVSGLNQLMSNTSPEQRANLIKQLNEEQLAYRKTKAQKQAELQYEPTPASEILVKWEGNKLITASEHMTREQQVREGWTTVALPTKQKERIDAYKSSYGEGEGLIEDIQKASDFAVKGDFFKAISQALAEGKDINLLNIAGKKIGITIPPIGQLALTQEQRSILTKATAYAQQIEKIINPGDDPNVTVGLIKSFVMGATAGRDGMIQAVRDIQETTSRRIKSELEKGPIGPGNRPSTVYPNTPTIPQQVQEDITPSGVSKITETILKKIDELAGPEQVSKLGKPFVNAWNTYLEWNKKQKGEAKGGEEEKSTLWESFKEYIKNNVTYNPIGSKQEILPAKESIGTPRIGTPSKRKSNPINRDVVKELKGFQE